MKSLIAITLLFVSGWLNAESVDSILDRVAQTQDVSPNLLRAICTVESGDANGIPNLQAFTQDDGGPGNHAFGACQVLLSTAEHLGFRDVSDRCRNYTSHQKAEYSTCGLFGPVTNFHFAAKYLKWQMKRYGQHRPGHPDKTPLMNVIAAYNSGTVRMCPADGRSRNRAGKVLGTCRKGEYVNQEYVTKVLRELEELGNGNKIH